MKTGPRPIPTNIKILRGETRPSRINTDEPQVKISIPDAPEYLSADEQTAFTETARKLAKMRVMTEADIDALAVYAVSFCRWRHAVERLRETGPLIRSPNNFPIQSPYLSIANKSQDQMLKVLIEFGLTPSSRTRVKAT